MELETELQFYESHRAEWLQHYNGKFALIKGVDLLGTYSTWDEALEEGVKRLGNVPFLVRRIQPENDTVQFPALAVGAISADS